MTRAIAYVSVFLAAGYVAGTQAVSLVQGILSSLPIGG